MSKLVFLDTETTGLDPERHEVFELAFIVRTDDLEMGPPPFHFWLPVDLSKADATALRLTDYYERHPWLVNEGVSPFIWKNSQWERIPFHRVLGTLASETANAHLIGAVPSFDAAFLERLLRRHGLAAAWHYHLVDVEALAAGKLGIAPPWNSEELSRAVGVEPADRHTAMGDALWARANLRRLPRGDVEAMSVETFQCEWHPNVTVEVGSEVGCDECNNFLQFAPNPKMMTGEERAEELAGWMNRKKLSVPFTRLHDRVAALVGRDLWTHEMANPEPLIEEARNWQHPENLNAHAVETLSDKQP